MGLLCNLLVFRINNMPKNGSTTSDAEQRLLLAVFIDNLILSHNVEQMSKMVQIKKG